MAALPTFTVIVPTFGRAKQLSQCLAALGRLEYPQDLIQVIVVDDGSPIQVGEVTAPFSGHFDLTLVSQPHRGPAAARNTGAAQARGSVLAFTDDDCTADPGWLAALAARLDRHPGHAIGGRTDNLLVGNLFSAASQMLIGYLYGYYNDRRPAFFASNNLAVPARLFAEVGGFNTDFMRGAGEDREFCDRWLNCGHAMTFAPEAIVHHAHPLSLESFWRQHQNYGRGAYQYHQLRALRGQGRIEVEPAKFYVDLIRYPFGQTTAGRAAVISLLLGVSQIANAAGFFAETFRHSRE